jgi:NAD-reducing hydrogenase large subunit
MTHLYHEITERALSNEGDDHRTPSRIPTLRGRTHEPHRHIEPVTRIEGHARITLQLGDAGEVEDAKFHLTQFRGFEKFCEGRPYREMPALTARTCGICPVSHVLASNKACDHLLSVSIPPTGEKLRRIINLAQLTQSHALSFFHLSSPDLLLGWDSDPVSRNIFGVMRQDPALAKDGIRLRQIGQTIIETLGGKKIHPTWVVPGGVSEPLTQEKRDAMLKLIPEGLEIAKRTYAFFKTLVPKFKDEANHFGSQPTMFLSLVSPKGTWSTTTASCDSRMPKAASSKTWCRRTSTSV